MKSAHLQQPYRNRVLASLPKEEIARLAAHLSPRTFKLNQILNDRELGAETVYFLEDGLCSIVVTMKDGSTVEAGIVGRESFVGMPAVLETGYSPNRGFVQIPGDGYAVRAKILVEQAQGGSGKLHAYLLRGVQALLAQVTQTAACNRLHELEQRLARWLLMCHDRVQGDDLPITHEFLAMMLGVHRSSLSAAAGTLRNAGLIEYSRGHVRIKNRRGREKTACQCYSIVHDEYVRLGLL